MNSKNFMPGMQEQSKKTDNEENLSITSGRTANFADKSSISGTTP